MTAVRRAVAGDAGALAGLHAACLPTSLLSSLGIAALARYYRFAIDSPHETVWAAVDLDTVVGGCVLSDAPHTVLGRFARHDPVGFARDLARATLGGRALRRRIAARFRDGVRGEEEASTPGPHVPEVTQIFTDARRRGEGIGAALLRTCEDTLRGHGVGAYYVHTERDDNARGIAFYTREGFEEIGRARSFGVDFLVLRKPLG